MAMDLFLGCILSNFGYFWSPICAQKLMLQIVLLRVGWREDSLSSSPSTRLRFVFLWGIMCMYIKRRTSLQNICTRINRWWASSATMVTLGEVSPWMRSIQNACSATLTFNCWWKHVFGEIRKLFLVCSECFWRLCLQFSYSWCICSNNDCVHIGWRMKCSSDLEGVEYDQQELTLLWTLFWCYRVCRVLLLVHYWWGQALVPLETFRPLLWKRIAHIWPICPSLLWRKN